MSCVFFFFNDTATTEIYTLSLHDALPICSFTTIDVPGACCSGAEGINDSGQIVGRFTDNTSYTTHGFLRSPDGSNFTRSEEHTSELQSLAYLVCRLLLEKKKRNTIS